MNDYPQFEGFRSFGVRKDFRRGFLAASDECRQRGPSEGGDQRGPGKDQERGERGPHGRHGHHEHRGPQGPQVHGRFGRRSRFGGLGGFGGPGMGGANFRAARMLASGDLQLIILALLSEKPRHGYEIIKQVEEHSSGGYAPSPGMVYPALTYLEEMGYAASETEGAKKLYKITEAGAAYLKENRANVEQILEQLERFGRRFAEFQKHFAEQEEEEEDERDPDLRHGIKAEWREAKRDKLRTAAAFRELRRELKSALYEKIDSPDEERERVLGILRRAVDEIRGTKV
jgi:DNA-binding PadR family transcriptional regulator